MGIKQNLLDRAVEVKVSELDDSEINVFLRSLTSAPVVKLVESEFDDCSVNDEEIRLLILEENLELGPQLQDFSWVTYVGDGVIAWVGPTSGAYFF